MATLPARPAPSAVQNLLQSHPIPPTSSHEPHLHHLALQVAHNLRYQHNWTFIRLHYYTSTTTNGNGARQALPRPLISGVPPQRLYVHPDEQIALLQDQKKAGKSGLPELKAEPEWVLPSHLREKWTLRRFGEVFGGIGRVPESREGEGEWLVEEDGDGEGSIREGDGNPWRAAQPKRLLLATLDDDSTVVYYIVHDGIVKPRQN